MPPKTAKLQIRLTADEKRLIQTAAKLADMTMSEWLRAVLVKASKAKVR